MIGDAVGGTYDAKTSKWNYTSKEGDMEYDANERCFSLTISTIDEKYTTPHYFRFVANHDAAQNWGETEDNVTTNTGLARSRYDGAEDDHHTVWQTIRTMCSIVRLPERTRQPPKSVGIFSGTVPQESGG